MKSKDSHIYYSADEVKPLRTVVTEILRKMQPGQAFNVESSVRQKYVTTISRLHKRKEGRWHTTKISPSQIAIIRKQ